MPKHFSETERTQITEQLLNAGFDQFTKSGLRAVRVDDLCRAVGIAKGSFYQFFDSKEDLFMAVAESRDCVYRQKITEMADTHTGTSPNFVAGLYIYMVEAMMADPIMDVVSRPGEFEYLLRKLPPERMAVHQRNDEAYFQDIGPRWIAKGLIRDVNPNLINELLIPVICVITRHETLPPEQFEVALNHLQTLFVSSLAVMEV